jgi:hypothetical protein
MDPMLLFIFGISGASLAALGLCLATNFQRERNDIAFELKPNCLLTRNPVLFVTGPRSIFYFRKYWNTFPSLLAEHGYEVFTLHLPWQGPLRQKKMREHLLRQEQAEKKYHFILDAVSAQEFASSLENSPCVLSLTIPQSAQFSPQEKAGSSHRLFHLSYTCHRLFLSAFKGSQAPKASELGAEFPRGRTFLLERMQALGEQDFLR